MHDDLVSLHTISRTFYSTCTRHYQKKKIENQLYKASNTGYTTGAKRMRF
jgi:hypothetical protein